MNIKEFKRYCKGKIRDMECVTINGVDYYMLMHSESIREFKNVWVVRDFESEDESFIVINSDDKIVINTYMITPEEYAKRLEFDQIDTEFYEDMIYMLEDEKEDE